MQPIHPQRDFLLKPVLILLGLLSFASGWYSQTGQVNFKRFTPRDGLPFGAIVDIAVEIRVSDNGPGIPSKIEIWMARRKH